MLQFCILAWMGTYFGRHRRHDRARLRDLFCMPLSFLSSALAPAWNHMDAARIPAAAATERGCASFSDNVLCCCHRKHCERPKCCGQLFSAGTIEPDSTSQCSD